MRNGKRKDYGKIFSYQGADPSRFSGQSQDIMNLVLDGEIKFIDRRYNGGSENGVLIYHFVDVISRGRWQFRSLNVFGGII